MDFQSFILPANGAATPDSIARKRKMAEAMLQSGMDTSPVASPWQGAARMAQALVGGLSQRKADKQEAEGKKSAKDALVRALTGGDKASMIDAMGNPWMDNASLNLIGDAYARANAPAQMKILDNGQAVSFNENDPTSIKAFEIPGYQKPAGFRPATAEEKAMYGVGEDVPLVFDGEGKPSILSGGGVTVNNMPAEQPMIGTIPPGYAAKKNLDGSYVMERIAGGPADETKVNDAKDNKRQILSDVVSNAADKARELVGMTSTGVVGQGMSMIGQSDAAEIYRQVNTLKANATIERLQTMRSESPTGGALGSVTQQENAMLADAAGALDPSAGPERFNEALDNYELTLDRIVHGYEAGTQLFMRKKAQKKAAQAAPGADPEIEALVQQYGGQ